MGVASGKLFHNYGKIHHAINGKINYFDWAIFNSKLFVYQRVPGSMEVGIWHKLVGGFKHDFYFPFHYYMGCHPKPIDELHHFSRWLLHHQPVMINRKILEYNQIYGTKKWKITDQQRFFGDFQSDHQKRQPGRNIWRPLKGIKVTLRHLVLSWDQEHRCSMLSSRTQGLKKHPEIPRKCLW